MTGFTDYEYSMGGKWLELLKEISPDATHITFLFNPDAAPSATRYIQSAQDAAITPSVTRRAKGVRDTETFERAIATLASAPNGGLIVMPEVFTFTNLKRIAELAERHRVPTVYPLRLPLPAAASWPTALTMLNCSDAVRPALTESCAGQGRRISPFNNPISLI